MANRSKAETEVLDTQIYTFIAKGLTTNGISVELKIPLRTIQTHTKNLMDKVKSELLNIRQEEVLADIQIAKSRFLEAKKMLRKILDDAKASPRALIKAIRTDGELNASLLKIGVEGAMFVKHHYAIQSESEQARVLRLDSKSDSIATKERGANNNTLGRATGVS
jgi:Bacterial regulatory proteins, luxR family